MSQERSSGNGKTARREATTSLGAFCLILGCAGIGLLFLYPAMPKLLGAQVTASGEDGSGILGGVERVLGVLAKVGLIGIGMLMLARRRSAAAMTLATLLVSMAGSIIRMATAQGSVGWEVVGAGVAAGFYLGLLIYLRLPASRREFRRPAHGP